MSVGVLVSQVKNVIQATSWTIGEESTCTLVPIAMARWFTVGAMMCGILMNCITYETTKSDEVTTGKKNLQGILQPKEELLE